MSFSFSDILQHMGGPAIVIAVILATMGLASLTVFVERIFTLRKSRVQSRQFATAAAPRLRAPDIEGARAEAQKYPKSFLARVVGHGLTAHVHARETADIGGMGAAERTRRQIERYLEEIGAEMRRGLAVLASVGSVAPFVGLLGTVVGIISAFQGIAATGSGGLSSVSAGISEALIETALGLAVAIPAVLAFNYLSNAISHDEGKLQRSAGELLDMIESWDESEAKELRRERVA